MRRAFASFLLLAACSSAGPSIEGNYYPGCTAFAGDRIRLKAGNFVWEKFTDAVTIDDDGRVVDPFPGFPRTGRYRLDGDALHLETSGADVVATFFIREDDGRLVLLTAAERAAADTTARIADCVLTRGDD